MLIVALLALAGCGGGNGTGREDAAAADSVMTVSHAKGFSVEYLPGYKRVTVYSPWEEGKRLAVYYLVKSADTETPEGGAKIVTPLKTLAVTSCTHFEFLDMLGELAFRHRLGQVQWLLEADVRGDRLVDQFIYRPYANRLQHGGDIFLGYSHVAIYKLVRVHNDCI